MVWRGWSKRQTGGLLTRLARDPRGNTLAMMAMALIPVSALAGSAVDMARLYVIKVRLQQACDAGALAGRKFMTGAGPTLDAAATAQANTFFANNFRAGWLNTYSVSFTPTRSTDNQVNGTASVQVPMSIMKMFQVGDQQLSVTCQARYDVADTDIIFVLDTTGSMSCLPSDDDPTCNSYVGSAGSTTYTRPADSSLGSASGSANDSVAGYPGSTGYYVPEKSGSRISAVRTAVVDFYNTVAANADPSTHIRYGFVTYTSTVNAGKAIQEISPTYMVGGAGNSTTTWTYNTRYIDPANTNSQYQVSSSSVYDATTNPNCNGSVRTPAATGTQPYTFNTSSSATVVSKAWDPSAPTSNKCKVTTTVYGPNWTYGPHALDVSGFLTNASVDDPTKLDATTNSWQGCIEERGTTPGVMSFSNSSLPADLDPDLVPSSDATRWRPMWPEVMYGRNYNGSSTVFGSTSSVMDNGSGNAGDTDNTAYYGTVNAFNYFYYGSGSLMKNGWSTCGKPVRRLHTMTLQDVTNYVNAPDFKPIGGTYHDTGMIWGTRLLSPNGIFANDTSTWAGHQAPNRVIVFLTDGYMAPAMSIYGMYGSEYFDQRVTGGDYANQKDYHNARFLAECAKAKSMNINVWTVSITTDATPTTQMQQCATTTAQALVSSSGSGLSSQFQAIAKQVAMLRISQ